jgi:octopine/nopaline transport system substrate-binding protein
MPCKALSLALTICTALAVTACSSDKPSLRIATDGAYPPYIATGPGGELTGLEADLVADFCRRMGERCEWVKQSFDGMIPGLQRERFDAIVSSLSITDERRKIIDFSTPYFVGPTVFMSRGDGPFRARLQISGAVTLDELDDVERKLLEATRAALAGATVGIQRASTHESFLKAYFADTVQIKTYGTGDELFLDLASGRVDLAVVGLGEMDSFVKEQAKAGRIIEPVGPGFRGGPLGHGVAVGLRNGDQALRERFDAAIVEANRDGTIRELGMKWFGMDGSPPLPPAG